MRAARGMELRTAYGRRTSFANIGRSHSQTEFTLAVCAAISERQFVGARDFVGELF